MRISAFVLLFSGLSVLVLGCISESVSRVDGYWQGKASQVTAGMSRSQVERLLPPLPQSPRMTLEGGGSQGESYWVDTNWLVRVTYDYTGIPRDSKGQALSHTSPENRLLAPPVLFQQQMPVVEVKTIKTIEPTVGGDGKPAPQP